MVVAVAVVLLATLTGAALPDYFFVPFSGPTVAECVSLCESQRPGSFPATITSAEQNAAIDAIFSTPTRGLIGGNRLSGNQTMHRWVTGPLGEVDGGLGAPFYIGTSRFSGGKCATGWYCNFDINQPDGFGEKQIEFISPGGTWNDITVSSPEMVGCICQAPAVKSQSATIAISSSLGNTEVWFVAILGGAVFDQCTGACRASRRGGHLATPRSAEENEALRRAIPAGATEGFLGGSRNIGNKSVYRWVTGPLGLADGGLGAIFYDSFTNVNGRCVAPYYCNFRANEPNNYYPGSPNNASVGEFWVTLFRSTGYWNDNTVASGCICQRNVPTIVPTMTLSSGTTNSATVSPGHTVSLSLTPTASAGVSLSSRTEMWYIFLRGETFLECIAACQESRPGGFLATPRTAVENAMLHRVLPTSVVDGFIGGSRNVGDRLRYRWVSGPLGHEDDGLGAVFYDSYTHTNGNCVAPYYCNFNVGEPNNHSLGPQARTGEYWVVMYRTNGKWNDDYFADGCLCQRDVPTSEPTASLSRTLSASAYISGSSTRTSTVLLASTTVSSSLLSSVTREPSISGHSVTLRSAGVVVLNASVAGSLLAAAPVGGNASMYVELDVVLVGTEFSPFFDWATVNCFSNASWANVTSANDDDAMRRVRAFVAGTSELRVTGAASARLRLLTNIGVYSVLTRRVEVSMSIRGPCLARSYLALSDVVTVEAAVSDPTQTALSESTQIVATTVSVVSPVTAVQAMRNNLALAIQYCEAEEGTLDVVRSPTTMALGDSTVSAYVGGAAMNHVLVLGMLVLLFGIVAARRWGVRCTWREAMSAARFPAPLAFPMMVLIEPTATCAVVTILFAEGYTVLIGYASLVLCGLYPIALLVYLTTGFAATRQAEPFVAAEDGGAAVRRFLFGSGKWVDGAGRDGEPAEGYCRRNGFLFRDYAPGRHWFMGVEMLLGTVLGAMEGIKLGYGRCAEVLYAVTIMLSVYLVAFFLLRPCVSPLANVYVLALTAMQVAGCVLLCLPQDASRTRTAGTLAEFGSMLVLGKSCVDVLDLIVFWVRSCQKWLQRRADARAEAGERHRAIEEISEVRVPAALLAQPLSILARRTKERAGAFPMLGESGVLERLDDTMYEARGVVLGALQRVCEANVAHMKRQAAHKYALDGVWRDWRDEAPQVPLELVALAQQLRGAENSIRAAETSRVEMKRSSGAPRRSSGDVKGVDGDDEEMTLLDQCIEPLLGEDSDNDGSVNDDATRRVHEYHVTHDGLMFVPEFDMFPEDEHFPDIRSEV